MADDILIREEKWPTGLARVIKSYMQGREVSRQRKLQERQIAALAEKARQEQLKTEAETNRIKIINAIMQKFARGGQRPGATGGYGYGIPGGKIGPPEQAEAEARVGDVLPGLELDGIGPSGPSFKVGGLSIEDALSRGVGGDKGYGKPTISVGPRGRVRGMTYTPQKQEYPAGFKDDLANAVSAISRGADPFKVYRRIASAYPGQSTELKRILLYTPDSKRLDAVREALFGGTQ